MIELERIYKRYRTRRHDREILAGVDLAIEPGDVVLVSGAMGCGKTTLLQLLYGAVFADAGVVRVFGRDVSRLRRSSLERLRQCMGIMPQSLALMDDRTAFDNVAVALEIRGVKRHELRERATEALIAVGLADDADRAASRRVSQLSIGQRQLVCLARAIAARPMVIVADEPTCHLDNAGRAALIELIASIQARGGAAVLATSDHKLLHAGAHHSWRHVELAAGTLCVIADRKPARPVTDQLDDADAAYESIEITAAASDEPGVEADVVPFPRPAAAGGMK